MHYRERFNIQGRNLEYIGIYIRLYGLTDLLIEYEYLELMKYDYISAAEASLAGRADERTIPIDKQLRCIAEVVEGRKFLAEFAYWGSAAHHAAKGYSRSAPDWYINPGGPTGYIVDNKIYSKYLYEPLSKEEFYKRNIGEHLPPSDPFKSIFNGVTGIFTRAIGLQRLMPMEDPLQGGQPVPDRLSIDRLDPLPGGQQAERPDPLPGGQQAERLAEVSGGQQAEVPAERPAEVPGGQPQEEGRKRGALVMKFTDDKGNVTEKRYMKPYNPAKLGKYIKRGGKYLTIGLAQIDRANESDLAKFAKEGGVDITAAKSLDVKKSLLKSAMLEKTAADMDVDKSVYSDLDTYLTKAGDHLLLSSNTEEKITRGLEIISDPKRFKGDDPLSPSPLTIPSHHSSPHHPSHHPFSSPSLFSPTPHPLTK